MRISADSEEGQKVKRVLLDEKPLIGVVEVDTDEGWAKVSLPNLDKENLNHYQVKLKNEEEVVNEKESPEFDWETKTLHGNVVIEWHEEKDNE